MNGTVAGREWRVKIADDCVRSSTSGRTHQRAARAASFVVIAAILCVPAFATVQEVESRSPAAARAGATATAGTQGAAELRPENAPEASQQSEHGESLWVVIARLVNFAILAGVLVYFLRKPIATYLARRSTEIRSDLVTAAETRQAAERDLAAIEQKMQALPGEIEALKTRGAAEIAAEEARIRQAADAERARLLEQARREIELQLRAAERELVKRAAELTVSLASDRIKRTITDEDQKRLVDQYLAQMNK